MRRSLRPRSAGRCRWCSGWTTAALSLALALALALPAAATQETSQTFQLQPGWNAVYLEVEPAVNDTATVFAALPDVDSVWTWSPSQSPVQFISDPSEPRLQDTGWLGYYPPARPEALLTNLFRVQANRPYLIKLGGASPVPWVVTGRPALRRPRWVPDAFNLVGAAVEPGLPPTYGQYFAASPAHDGQPIYRLEPGGTWLLTPPSTAMASGEAFWIFTAGGSDYAGPMHLELAAGDGVDFGAGLTELEVTLSNRSAAPAAYSARLLTPGPIAYQTFDATDGSFTWNDFAPSAEVTAEPQQRAALRLAVRRADLVGDVFDSILELTDGAGSRRLLPLRALQFGAVAPEGLAAPANKSNKSSHSLAGLWAGTASLDRVSALPDEVPGAGTAPPLAPTVSSSFDLRLLIHVDDGGQARLLKEVIQMWEDGTLVPDPADPDHTIADPPGHFVLVTREEEIFNFEGSALADGEQVGRRLATAGYDFDDASAGWDAATATLLLTGGGFGAGGAILDTTITLPPTHPSNPFYHRYHPDHDQDCGCDTLFTPGTPEHDNCLAGCAESFELERTLELTFDATDPTVDAGDDPRPDWGVTRVAGSYLETVSGLHRLPLAVAGTFNLRRVSDQGALNR